MRKFLLYFLLVIILLNFSTEIYFFCLFYESIGSLARMRDASSILKSISMDSMKIYSGLDVSRSIEELKEGKQRFGDFLRKDKNLKGINYNVFSSLWEEVVNNLDLLMKNERGSRDFFRAYHEVNNLIDPVIREFETSEKKLRAETRSSIIKFGLAHLILIILLPLFFIFSQKKAFFELKKEKLGMKTLLKNLSKEVEELSDEIEEISTKTIKLSLRKSESEYSIITSNLEEMKKRIDSFIKEALEKEEGDYRKSFHNLIDSLSLSLNTIITGTMVEIEKFKDMEKSLEKINEKLSFLKKKVAEIYLSIKNIQSSF